MTSHPRHPLANQARMARKTRAWQQARAKVIATQTHCGICGQPVDKTLSGRHPLGPTADHRTPLTRGGSLLDPTNLQLAHLRCNSAKKNRPSRKKMDTSRDWLA